MSASIKIAELERILEVGYIPPNLCTDALPALLRLARASDRYAWMLSKDGPGEDEEHVVEAIVAEWKAARATFDFTSEETTS